MGHSSLVTAILTPPGRGAIATVAVCGAGAIAAADRSFLAASGVPLSKAPANRIVFGRFRSTTGGEEEVVAVVTGIDRLELHCHGGPAAAEAIAAALGAAGAVRITWQSYLEQVEKDRIRAEAREALALATTQRTCAILLDQYQGALGRELREIESQLATGQPQGRMEARGRIEELLDRWKRIGRRLVRPWRVMIAGPPNVGKSSLLNALLGYSRSIEYDQPGTTRDVICAPVAVDGWPLELIDAAGLRTPGDPLEAAGVERAHGELAAADGVLAVIDMTRTEVPPWSRQLLASEQRPVLWIGNKSDLLSPPERERWRQSWSSTLAVGVLAVSAKTGDGIDALTEAIAQRLVGDPPPAGAAVPFLPRHADYLRELQQQSSGSCGSSN